MDYESEVESYFSRNKRWLIPLIAGFMIIAMPAVSALMQQPATLPSVVTTGGGLLCAFAFAFGAMQTDTRSGYIAARLGLVAAVVLVGVAVLKQISL
jgi:hypothetical protein